MRAFMSDIGGGPVFLDKDNPLGNVFNTPAREYAARWAENEACMIVNEVEPTNTYSDENRMLCLSVRELKPRCLPWDIALAEALETLIEVCDYLSAPSNS